MRDKDGIILENLYSKVLLEKYYDYNPPSDKKMLMYDFYVLNYLQYLLPFPSKGFRGFRELPVDIVDSVKDAANKLYPYLKKELLDAVFFSICAEWRHFSDYDENYDRIVRLYGDNENIRKFINFYDRYRKFYRKGSKEQEELTKIFGVEKPSAKERPPEIEKKEGSQDRVSSYKAVNYALEQTGMSRAFFVTLARDCYIKLRWSSSYGGDPWCGICKGWLLLDSAEGMEANKPVSQKSTPIGDEGEHEFYKQKRKEKEARQEERQNEQQQQLTIPAAIDHIYDLQHNTDTVFNKLRSYYKGGYGWIDKALTEKANVKSYYDLLRKTSGTIRALAPKVLYNKLGETWESYSKNKTPDSNESIKKIRSGEKKCSDILQYQDTISKSEEKKKPDDGNFEMKPVGSYKKTEDMKDEYKWTNMDILSLVALAKDSESKSYTFNKDENDVVSVKAVLGGGKLSDGSILPENRINFQILDATNDNEIYAQKTFYADEVKNNTVTVRVWLNMGLSLLYHNILNDPKYKSKQEDVKGVFADHQIKKMIEELVSGPIYTIELIEGDYTVMAERKNDEDGESVISFIVKNHETNKELHSWSLALENAEAQIKTLTNFINKVINQTQDKSSSTSQSSKEELTEEDEKYLTINDLKWFYNDAKFKEKVVLPDDYVAYVGTEMKTMYGEAYKMLTVETKKGNTVFNDYLFKDMLEKDEIPTIKKFLDKLNKTLENNLKTQDEDETEEPEYSTEEEEDIEDGYINVKGLKFTYYSGKLDLGDGFIASSSALTVNEEGDNYKVITVAQENNSPVFEQPLFEDDMEDFNVLKKFAQEINKEIEKDQSGDMDAEHSMSDDEEENENQIFDIYDLGNIISSSQGTLYNLAGDYKAWKEFDGDNINLHIVKKSPKGSLEVIMVEPFNFQNAKNWTQEYKRQMVDYVNQAINDHEQGKGLAYPSHLKGNVKLPQGNTEAPTISEKEVQDAINHVISEEDPDFDMDIGGFTIQMYYGYDASGVTKISIFIKKGDNAVGGPYPYYPDQVKHNPKTFIKKITTELNDFMKKNQNIEESIKPLTFKKFFQESAEQDWKHLVGMKREDLIEYLKRQGMNPRDIADIVNKVVNYKDTNINPFKPNTIIKKPSMSALQKSHTINTKRKAQNIRKDPESMRRIQDYIEGLKRRNY